MSNTRQAAPGQHPARAEATGQPMVVNFRGYAYKIPPSSLWPLEAIEAAENDRIATSTRLILGNDQWTEFRKRNQTLGDLEAFMEKAAEANGGNL